MKVCSIEGCDRKPQGRGMCSTHYSQLWRSGKFVKTPTIATCTVAGCEEKHNAKGLCLTHYFRVYRNGTLEKRKAEQFGDNNPNWVGDDAEYSTVHSRLRAQRGPARQFGCVDCNKQALHWSYDYECPNEIPSPVGPYSTDLDRYHPRCASCHTIFDMKMEAGLMPA